MTRRAIQSSTHSTSRRSRRGRGRNGIPNPLDRNVQYSEGSCPHGKLWPAGLPCAHTACRIYHGGPEGLAGTHAPYSRLSTPWESTVGPLPPATARAARACAGVPWTAGRPVSAPACNLITAPAVSFPPHASGRARAQHARFVATQTRKGRTDCAWSSPPPTFFQFHHPMTLSSGFSFFPSFPPSSAPVPACSPAKSACRSVVSPRPFSSRPRPRPAPIVTRPSLPHDSSRARVRLHRPKSRLPRLYLTGISPPPHLHPPTLSPSPPAEPPDGT